MVFGDFGSNFGRLLCILDTIVPKITRGLNIAWESLTTKTHEKRLKIENWGKDVIRKKPYGGGGFAENPV